MSNATRLTGDKNEPRYLRRWPTRVGQLYSCARPGRGTYGTSHRKVDDRVLKEWVANLPNSSPLQIVSLLGNKRPDRVNEVGMSEFVFYPFRSCHSANDDRPTFQEWLASHPTPHVVHEFPTIDRVPLSPVDIAEAAVGCVITLLEQGKTVLVVDSGGVQRTGELCERILASGLRQVVRSGPSKT